jgi:glycerol uptake facilitator-like aquaporin
MNPAVSFAMLVTGKMGPLKFLVYVIAQALGALFGAVVVYGIYFDALQSFDGGLRQITGENKTAGIWATYPQPYLSSVNAFFDQVLGTGLLVLIVLAVGDEKNESIKAPVSSILVALTVSLIGMTFGQNCGYAISGFGFL